MSYGTIAIAFATLACLLYRLATSSRPRRRALLPVYVPALLLTVPVLIFHGAVTRHLHLDPGTIDTVGWFLTVGWVALPYGFLLAIVQTRFFAAAALTAIVGKLVDTPNAPQLRRILADALDVDAAGRYGEDVERAVYFCCLEGLQNVAKHAGPGAKATIRIREHDHELRFEISDDGVGCDLESVRGSGRGHSNMTERRASVRGSFAVESAPGQGTAFSGRVPVAHGR